MVDREKAERRGRTKGGSPQGDRMKQKMSEVEGFLGCKRLALVGASRDEKQISRHLLKAFVERDYDVVPVNRHAEDIAGMHVAGSVQDIYPPVDAALIVLSGDKAEQAVEDALAAGVKQLWLYGVTGPKSIAPALLERVQKEDVTVIAGYCPFMFLDDAEWGHRAHAWVWKALGMLPKRD